MPEILCNGANHYYEQAGEGAPLVFVHGAFGDTRLWEPQWAHFSAGYRVLRYDLRGHGRTGASDLARYSMETYADDLAGLLDAVGIDTAVICGLSWGGGIAQVFAVRYPDRLKGLVLAGSTVSMSLTLGEKLLRYVFFPRSAMMLVIRTLSVEQFVRFSFWLSGLTLGRDWLNKDEGSLVYLRACMLQIERSEYLKIWGAIYGFDLPAAGADPLPDAGADRGPGLGNGAAARPRDPAPGSQHRNARPPGRVPCDDPGRAGGV